MLIITEDMKIPEKKFAFVALDKNLQSPLRIDEKAHLAPSNKHPCYL